MGLIKEINKPKILIYDDENIAYVVGDLATFEYEPEVEYYESGGINKAKPIRSICSYAINEAKKLDNIMLDETTMKRVAKRQSCFFRRIFINKSFRLS